MDNTVIAKHNTVILLSQYALTCTQNLNAQLLKGTSEMKPHITVVQSNQTGRNPTESLLPEWRPAIFVTGAASGIGRACAELFARRGWFVGLYDIDSEGVAAVAAILGEGNAVSGALDVNDPEAWKQALMDFWAHSGQRLDVLLNNAGILAAGQFEAVPLTRHQAMLDVNVSGMITGCHSAFRYLRGTPCSHVINGLRHRNLRPARTCNLLGEQVHRARIHRRTRPRMGKVRHSRERYLAELRKDRNG
nr:SDR family NAD(P)-dependent oxidoreductase [Pseudomonas frederiksbergensis]